MRSRVEIRSLGSVIRWRSLSGMLALATLLAPVFVRPARAQKFSVLHTFTGGADGSYPVAGLIQHGQEFYGTTEQGGAFGFGTIFQVDSTGKETVLYSFSGGSTDGEYPQARLTRDAAGNLYGTALGGAQGFGIVFRLDTGGHETVLHNFNRVPDGAYPYSNLALDSTGNLYGTTMEGGTFGLGAVFRIDASGRERVLYSFKGGTADGEFPTAGLIQDPSGSLFGTTTYGGTVGFGTLFRLNPAGKETIVHHFKGSLDGSFPFGNLMHDNSWNLYGATDRGGRRNLGVVFRITSAGREKVLYNFRGKADGQFPEAGLVGDDVGNLFGTTFGGGDNNAGTLFELNGKGQETVLYKFTGGSDGAFPQSSLVLDSRGTLYGTASGGGTSGLGTVFQFTP